MYAADSYTQEGKHLWNLRLVFILEDDLTPGSRYVVSQAVNLR